VGLPLITQCHKAKLNAPSEICPITQGYEQLATHLRMNSARLLGRRTIYRNGTSGAWRSIAKRGRRWTRTERKRISNSGRKPGNRGRI